MNKFFSLKEILATKLSIQSLVVFRILFGITMLWECYRYLHFGWIKTYWITPNYHFHYEFLEWIKPWPGDGMYIHFIALAILALFITIGFMYRISSILFFLGFSYVFLLEQARYLNHFYLICILSFLLIFLPSHRFLSVDSYVFKTLRSTTIPSRPISLLRFQLGIVYFFGGIAKLNADWLTGEPMRMWLANRTDFPLLGPYFREEWYVLFMSYSGLLIDLLAFPLLLFKRTRPYIFLALICFHFINDRLFVIGIFPWFMLGATTLFFPADWPGKLGDNLLFKNGSRESVLSLLSGVLLVVLSIMFRQRVTLIPMLICFISGALICVYLLPATNESSKAESEVRNYPVLVFLLSFWCLLQLLLPIRHYFIKGNVNWTEEGHRFSWHMKLRDKDGKINFYYIDPKTATKSKIAWQSFIKPWQYRKMATRPYLIRQFAQFLGDELSRRGLKTRILVESEASLNNRPYQTLIDPSENLNEVEYYFFSHNKWIIQLKEE